MTCFISGNGSFDNFHDQRGTDILYSFHWVIALLYVSFDNEELCVRSLCRWRMTHIHLSAANTCISRRTPDIQIVSYCADMEEAKQMLKNRLAYGIIYTL